MDELYSMARWVGCTSRYHQMSVRQRTSNLLNVWHGMKKSPNSSLKWSPAVDHEVNWPTHP